MKQTREEKARAFEEERAKAWEEEGRWLEAQISKALLGKDPALKELFETEIVEWRCRHFDQFAAGRGKKGKGRPRHVPEEGRATSNPWRDNRRRKEAEAVRARIENYLQIRRELDLPQRHLKILWATMDRICK
jgi:hypothetical protein